MNNKLKELINSLIKLTKNKRIEWNAVTEYLEENRNEILRRFIINSNQYYDQTIKNEPYLQEYKSYCVQFNDGYIYVFSFTNFLKAENYYILCTQNKKASSIITLNTSDTYQEDIRKLVLYIQNQFDNIDSFVDSIISEGNTIIDK